MPVTMRGATVRGFTTLGGFIPAMLFANNEQGAWYDPSDRSTLFQNSTGTTPVTAVEQPVRLMLDRSRGLVLGAELYTGGTINCVPIGGPAFTNYNLVPGATVGRWYRIQFTVTGYAGSGIIGVSGNIARFEPDLLPGGLSANGVFDAVGFLATSGGIALFSESTNTATITNISVRELPGNHAVAPNDASRPVLRARYNLLTNSQRFISPWNSSGAGYDSTITNNVTIAPDGTNTGSLFASQNLGGTGTAILAFVFSATSGTTYTLSFFAKANTLSWMTLFNLNYGANGHTYFDLGNGLIGNVAALNTATITSHANGWYRCAITFTATVTGSGEMRAYLADGNNDVTIARDGNTSVYIWGAQLLTAADQTATGGAYQRVGAATDYDTSNPVWRPYLAFDGSDDSMSTASVDFSGTDEMTVFAGVTKLTNPTGVGDPQIMLELSADRNTNNGAFTLASPADGTVMPTLGYIFASKGTNSVGAQVLTGYPAPITNVLTGIGDIGGDVATLRVNGVQAVTNTGDQGTGNYGNYPLFIGRRNNTSNPFNGRLYSLAVLGRTATAAEISAMETWINGKTGAY